MNHLTDKSWMLHYTSTPTTSYDNLFTTSTTPSHLSRYFDRLATFLQSQGPQYKDELNDENEKLGSLRDVKYSIHHVPSSQPSNSRPQFIHIALIYQHTTFTFVLYTPHLILSKSTASHTKRFLNFLTETFNIQTYPLKLPSSLLSTSLQRYISALTSHLDRADELIAEHRASILRSAVGTLKLTISFSGSVAPHLRTMEMSVPYETVDILSGQRHGGFLKGLTEHLHLQTGLRLSIVDDGGVNGGGGDGDGSRRAESVGSESLSGAPLKLSKMTCAAFAISVDGRLRFAEKAIENALNYEDVVVAANSGLLNDITEEVKRRKEVEGSGRRVSG